MFVRRVVAAAAIAWAAVSAAEGLAAPTTEQRAEIQAVGTAMSKAGKLYKESKFKEAAEVLKDAQARLEKLADSGDAQVINQLAGIHKRLINAHALLELEGIALPELKPLEKTAPGKAAAKGGAPSVSFVKDVAPILSSRCGNCHVRQAKGMFSMATYDSLMRGSPAGKVVFPGNVPGSDLVVKVEDKEMPPSGAGIPDTELSTLRKWVQEGARFDGPDPGAQLTSYAKPANQPAGTPPTAMVQVATGSESISFARDIAPVLAQRCTDCHGNQNPRNGLNLNSISTLMRGGDRGEPVLPGKPAESLLIKKLKGTADGQRMPQRGGPLDDATIAKFEKWIAEGAKYDGATPTQPVAQVAAIAKARASTHEQLTADRATLAGENWLLGMPGTPANRSESANFLVLGNVGENTLADIAKRAESLAPKVGKIFAAPADQPLVKGRVTLFVFGDRYNYGEFGKMVEKRDLPTSWRGHFGYTIVDAYAAVQAPKGNEYSLDALIAQELAAVYVSSLGSGVPRWFAEGCGRVVASRIAPSSDTRVSKWDEELSGVVGSLAAPDDFIKDKLPAEQSDVCSFSFAKFLMTNRGFPNLIDLLRKGGDFKKSFNEAIGATPEQMAAAWVRNPPKVGRLRGSGR
jgi:hypothetical protein